jgi:alpha-tubulin suppressor-like RCC1 family protein
VGLRIDGTVLATGARYRESGNRARGVAHSPRANPCAVDKWKNVKSIFCAGDVTLGLCGDGRVLAAGSSHYGQCKTEGWSGVVSVATSGNHTVALFEDGHVEAVGLNENGECRTEEWSGVIQIAVMPELTLGLCADGTVLAAGRHHEVLRTLDPVRAIACFGSSRQVFVMADGTVRLHRRGSEYLPEPLADTRIFLPSVTDSVLTRTATGTIPVSMARRALDCFDVGMDHTATVEKTGRLSVTGANENGQCDIRAHSRAVAVSAGPYHTAAILADGRIALNGRNQDGRCNAGGLNLELDSVGISADEARGNTSPATAEREPRVLHYAWKQVSCGYTHTAALRTDGRVYAVGANPDGRCDTRKWRDVTHLSCGIRHTLAAMADGTCTATGDNRYGQCDVSHWKGITLVAAGEFHSVGLRADGRVEAVGDNRKGQCRVEDLCDIISVACLPEATLCVRADGRVILRGGSGEHDKAVEALREVIAIHTCEHRIAALTADGRLLQIPQGVEAQAE